MAIISKESGSLPSATSKSITLPAGTRRVRLSCLDVTMSAASSLRFEVRKSAVATTFVGMRNNNNGTTINANVSTTSPGYQSTTATGTFMLDATIDFLDDASVRTTVRSIVMCDNEKRTDSYLVANAATDEDTLVITTGGGGNFTAGTYYAVFMDDEP